MSEGPRKCKKLPVVVESFQYDGTNAAAIEEWSGGAAKRHNPDINDGGPARMIVHTREGVVMAAPGDYIMRGVRDDFYPCGEEIYRETYEEVES